MIDFTTPGFVHPDEATDADIPPAHPDEIAHPEQVPQE